MVHFTYVIISDIDSSLYKGMTDDFERRIKEHNSGKVKSTKGKRPWRLFLLEEHPTKELARSREVYLKSGVGREWLNKLKNNPAL